jgi:hypothetical protein
MIIVSLMIASVPVGALSVNNISDSQQQTKIIGIDDAKNRISNFNGNSAILQSTSVDYKGTVESPLGESYDLSIGNNRYFVNKENGDIELAYFSDALSNSGSVSIDLQSAEKIAETFAQQKYTNFGKKNMQLIESKLYDDGYGGREYNFGWAEKINGIATLNQVYISVNAYNGKIISYQAKDRVTTITLEPKLTQSDAIKIAINQFNDLKDLRTDAIVSVICLKPNAQRLAWVVNINAAPKDGFAQGGQVVIDAINGEVILFNPFN